MVWNHPRHSRVVYAHPPVLVAAEELLGTLSRAYSHYGRLFHLSLALRPVASHLSEQSSEENATHIPLPLSYIRLFSLSGLRVHA